MFHSTTCHCIPTQKLVQQHVIKVLNNFTAISLTSKLLAGKNETTVCVLQRFGLLLKVQYLTSGTSKLVAIFDFDISLQKCNKYNSLEWFVNVESKPSKSQ
jgi:hypothetical protein